MENIEFNENQPMVSRPSPVSAQPKGLYKLVISLGLAKDQKGAEGVLIAIAIIAILIGVVYPFLVL